MNNKQITNEEQLKDFIFEMNEISSIIAATYFIQEDIALNEIMLLSDLKTRFTSAAVMIDHIVSHD
jgi:hypothetical protein